MYVKVFHSIVDSSIWREPESTRIVWLTLLATCDPKGYARYASPWNLSRRANVSEEDTVAAIRRLESPDPCSSDPANEGRRIVREEGGWRILNYPKYRALRTAEDRREYYREYKREVRAAAKAEPVIPKAAPKKKSGLEDWVKDQEFIENFKTIWDEYPKKEGKAGAINLLWKIKLEKGDEELQAVYDATCHYAKARAGEDPKFTMLATTWLNGRYLDWVKGDPSGKFNPNKNPKL